MWEIPAGEYPAGNERRDGVRAESLLLLWSRQPLGLGQKQNGSKDQNWLLSQPFSFKPPTSSKSQHRDLLSALNAQPSLGTSLAGSLNLN